MKKKLMIYAFIISLLIPFFSLRAQTKMEKEVGEILLDYHYSNFTEMVKKSSKEEVKKILQNYMLKKIDFHDGYGDEKKRFLLLQNLSYRAAEQLGNFMEVKDFELHKNDLAFTMEFKKTLPTLPPFMMTTYWNMLANTSSIEGNEELLSYLRTEDIQNSPSKERVLIDLLLISLEGVDTKNFGVPVQQGEYYAPNLAKPFFNKPAKSKVESQLIELYDHLKSIIETRKYQDTSPELHAHLLQSYKRATALRNGKVEVMKVVDNNVGSKESSAPTVTNRLDPSEVKREVASVVKRQLASGAHQNLAVEEENRSAFKFKWWYLIVGFFILGLVIFAYRKK